jgi:hypothetical protein
MILRSWICGNARCEHWFDSYEANPECPRCRCVRVSWRPAGGHIGTGAKALDATLRELVDAFELPDIHSAERGRAAKVIKAPPPVPAGSQVHRFGEFSAAINPAGGAQCVPTTNRIDYKVKATPGNAVTPNSGFANMSVRGNTAIEASHKAGR